MVQMLQTQPLVEAMEDADQIRFRLQSSAMAAYASTLLDTGGVHPVQIQGREARNLKKAQL